MSHLLGLDGVGLSVAHRTLFDQVSLGLDDGDRVGVLGPNGAGKSTLLRLVARGQAPDSGRVTHLGGLRVGLLDQRDPAGSGTVLDAVHGDLEEHAWASDAAVHQVHAGLLG
ncbi:MAG TPA: ATP-binding cassette domain-containing protein, partial [Actinotalea sp.]|nr:ATP-binding cassette domain-containing protein [Actinotalea sp.]